MYFSKDTYILRRRLLMDRLGHGVAVIFGNNNSPINYPSNAYHFRQDSTMMYYTGLERDGLALVLDCDNRREILFGDDIDLDDIVWMGFTPSVANLAESTGIEHSRPMKGLAQYLVPGIANVSL